MMASTGCRNDDLVKLLNRAGYQPIVLPRTNVQPPEMYTYANDQLIRRGPLADYLAPGTEIPPLRKGKLGNMQHKRSSRKQHDAAAAFLGDALQCIGIISMPKIDLSFAKKCELTFSFTGVTYAAVDSSRIDHLLGGLRTGAIPQDYIDAGQLHIAYDYAYAASLIMQRSQSSKASANFKAIKIQQFIDVGDNIHVEVDSETTISFRSTSGHPAAFAYKLGRLWRQGDGWAFFPEEVMGEGWVGDEGEKIPYLLERGVVLKVETED
jgi:hypothetical protein